MDEPAGVHCWIGSYMRVQDFVTGRAAAPWRIGQVFDRTPDTIPLPELVRALFRLHYVDGKDVQVQTWYVLLIQKRQRMLLHRCSLKSTCSSCANNRRSRGTITVRTEGETRLVS